MKHVTYFITFFIHLLVSADIRVGIGRADITPAIGTPSAGYAERGGEGMQGIHDPVLALALFIDNGEKQIALCSVDHLGFTYTMTQEVCRKVHATPGLAQCEVYIASSHTHSGGGAYLNIPVIGKILAGTYDPDITTFYIDKTTEAIIQAYSNQIDGKIGIGYGHAEKISTYRGLWPKDQAPLTDVCILKVTDTHDVPFAVLFNYPVHPTILDSHNRLFSADFVGYTRDNLQSFLGATCQPIYFNGAQGDILPLVHNNTNRFEACSHLGASLAKTVKDIWDSTQTTAFLDISTQKTAYTFKPQATPFGQALPVDLYSSEMNIIVLNQQHAFITIPGELSCVYDKHLKDTGKNLGFTHVSIFGLTNDAHGYIISPESWRHKTMESGMSFGGEDYGTLTKTRAEDLLKEHAPKAEILSLDVIPYEALMKGHPETLTSLEKALQEKGIVGVSGIPNYKEKVLNFIKSAQNFSSLPENIKESYAPNRALGETFLGYEAGKEQFQRSDGSWVIDDLKTSYYALIPDHPSNKWPTEVDLKDSFQDLGALMSTIGEQIMHQIGLLGPKTGINLHNSHGVGRMLYYRKNTQDFTKNHFWCGSHFDHGIFTALIPAFYFVDGKPIQEPEEAGLFVKTTQEGVFKKVSVNDPDVLLFQVGEFGQLATHDAIRATEHRVHKAQGSVERYTLALFFSPSMDTEICSFSELTNDPRYGGALGTPCSYQKWHEASLNRYRVTNSKQIGIEKLQPEQ